MYFFNPDHDLALAHSDKRYDALQSATKFASDCAALPLWYALNGSSVYAPNAIEWAKEMNQIFPQLRNVKITSSLENAECLSPWGWNVHLCKMVKQNNVRNLPTEEYLKDVRRLSHRRFAVDCLRFLREKMSVRLPQLPNECFSLNEVNDCLKCGGNYIFKAPWSGSGKGLFRVSGDAQPSFSGWAKNVILQQGSVMAEQYYKRVADFAMEFLSGDNKVSFAGYSLFNTTERCAYSENELLENEAIEQRLSKFISKEVLEQTKHLLLQFFEQNVAPFYKGYFGVDMFVYEQDGQFFLHPCVEINMRMTMGIVSRIFYDRFVEQGKFGFFRVGYCSKNATLSEESRKFSLEVIGGKIRKGKLSLCPITFETQYYVIVEVI